MTKKKQMHVKPLDLSAKINPPVKKNCGTCGYQNPHLHDECPMCKFCTCKKTIMACECKEGE